MVRRNSAQKELACIWESKWVGVIAACEQAFGRAGNYFFPKQRACSQARVIAIEIEKTQIHFLCDAFVAVAVVVS